MSHTTKVGNVAISSLAALRAAVENLREQGVNCELVENQKPRMYYDHQHGVCPLVLKLPDCPYDVGFDLQADGSYAPVFDEWRGAIAEQIGATKTIPGASSSVQAIGRLLQEYGIEAAREAAIAQGYVVDSIETDVDGNKHLVVSGM